MSCLVIASNRIVSSDDKGNAGGFAVGVLDALKATGGLWFGWGDNTGNEDKPLKKITRGNVTQASFSLSEQGCEEYYCQLSSTILWPTFHYQLDLIRSRRPAWEGYQRANVLLVDKLLPLPSDDNIIWVYDCHLLPLAYGLCKCGIRNRIGLFLHIPFPTPEIFNALPPHLALLEQICDFDLLGFQVENDRQASLDCLIVQVRVTTHRDKHHQAQEKVFRIQVYPIGTESDEIARRASDPLLPKLAQLRTELKNVRNILSMEHPDYSKGLSERFQVYEVLLEHYPRHHGKIRYTQTVPTSHEEVQVCQDTRHQLETGTGRISGKYGRLGWTPLYYLNQYFNRKLLMKIFHYLDVELVIPLCDGVNLMAKEFMAIQDPTNSDVLVSSQFAGVTSELTSALIVGPYDRNEVVDILNRASTMPLTGRIPRYAEMFETIIKGDVDS